MAQTQRDVRNRISSVKDIQKITRAMEMVAAARLRRAVARIEDLRPYADAIRRMTRQAAEAAGTEVRRLPLLARHERDDRLGLLLLTGDRGLAGAFNSHVLRAGLSAAAEHESGGSGSTLWWVSGRRGVSSLTFRGREPSGSYVGFTDRPSYADARRIAGDVMAAYVDGEVDRVQIVYNQYISPLTQHVRRETLLPLDQAELLGEDGEDGEGGGHGAAPAGQAEQSQAGPTTHPAGAHALVEYEPAPEEILRRLIPDYVEISIYRALLESTASEHGARMTAMRSASENAKDVIAGLTLDMNRARQAEITQEIMEVVAGAEGLT